MEMMMEVERWNVGINMECGNANGVQEYKWSAGMQAEHGNADGVLEHQYAGRT